MRDIFNALLRSPILLIEIIIIFIFTIYGIINAIINTVSDQNGNTTKLIITEQNGHSKIINYYNTNVEDIRIYVADGGGRIIEWRAVLPENPKPSYPKE